MQDLQSSLEESKSQVLMMQSAASLIVLQIIGRRRTLTENETNDLAELKLKMGLLLVALQDAKLLSPVPTKKPERIVRPDSASSRGKFITDEIFDAGVAKEVAKEISVPPRTSSRPTVEEEESVREYREPECVVDEHNPEQKETKSRPRPSSLLPDGRVVDNEPDNAVSSRDSYYEAWAIYAKSPPKMRTIRFLGLGIKIKDNNSADFDSYSGLAATQNEILDLLAQLNPALRSSSKSSSTLQQLVALTPPTARTVTHLISGRTEATKGYPGPRTCAIELLIPWSSIKSASEKSLLGSTLGRQTINLREVGYGYLLILRSPEPEYGTQAIDGDKLMEPSRDDNPFGNDWTVISIGAGQHGVSQSAMRERGRLPLPSPSPSPTPSRRFPPSPIHQEFITHRRHIDHGYGGDRRAKVRIEEVDDGEDKVQAQKDAEIAVNDFLASFSALYDGVPPEERTKVLDSVTVPEQGDDSGSESDESNSTKTSLRSYGDV